jgi:dolichol-phosphate mannosyltransferase
VLDLLHSYREENPYLRGYIAALGYRQVGVGYDRAKRERGKSSFHFRSLVNLALDGIVSHSILPLRLASFVGVSCSVLAVLAIIVYFSLWLLYEQTWPAGFATIAILMLLSLALNAVFLGIIGEYLARIYSQVKPQPLTIVEKFVDRTDPSGDESANRATKAVAGVVLPLGDTTPTASNDRFDQVAAHTGPQTFPKRPA